MFTDGQQQRQHRRNTVHITNKKKQRVQDLEPWGSNFEPVTLYEDRNIAVLNRFAYVIISNNKKKLQDDQYILM